jgi:hypothetical protein
MAGFTGHIVVITQQAELTFVQIVNFGSTWIGISDEETEGVWRIVTGPEAGSLARFLPWSADEPNGNIFENCIEMTQTTFSDRVCSNYGISVVEFECNVSPAANDLSSCPCKSEQKLSNHTTM